MTHLFTAYYALLGFGITNMPILVTATIVSSLYSLISVLTLHKVLPAKCMEMRAGFLVAYLITMLVSIYFSVHITSWLRLSVSVLAMMLLSGLGTYMLMVAGLKQQQAVETARQAHQCAMPFSRN
jgi:putative Mn2+ efflux pump MntP